MKLAASIFSLKKHSITLLTAFVVMEIFNTAIFGTFAGDSLLKAPSAFPQMLYIFPAATLGPRKIQISISGSYGADNSLVRGINGAPAIRRLSDNRSIPTGLARTITGAIECRYGIHRMVDVSLDVPFYYDITGWGDIGAVAGDLSIAGIMTPLPSTFPLQAGIRADVIFPSGNFEQSYFPRHVYYLQSDATNPGQRNVNYLTDRVYVHPALLVSLDMQRFVSLLPLSVHLNAGCITTGVKEAFALDASFGIAMRPVQFLQIGAEISGEVRPFLPGRSIIDALQSDPLRCAPSLAVDLPAGFSILLAGEIGLSNGRIDSRMNWLRKGYVYSTKATSQLGVALSVVYRGSPFRKRNGTSSDNEYNAAVARWAGDRDRDSIPDSLDQCPETPEDHDGFQNEDGCPDYDNDSDQVVDERDGCPDNPEDKDGFEDRDGCPDVDNDGDQVPDSIDACPDEAGVERNRGCPMDGALPFVRTVLSEVTFSPGSSKILSGQKTLDRIAKFMKETPKSAVEIQVHTDNRGAAADNATLSKKRAEVIKLYLVSKGIRSDRIAAIGMGSEFPIADNSTKEGRSKNRRVEIRRVQ